MYITFTVDSKRIAALASNARNNQVSGQEAEAFLTLYAKDLEDSLGEHVKEFVKKRLEAK